MKFLDWFSWEITVSNFKKLPPVGTALIYMDRWTLSRHNNPDNSGIYELTCGTCQGVYIGQTGRSISIRYKEHVRYIKNNNPQSGYALHILNTRHEFGPQETIKLIKYCKKGKLMNTWESMFIQKYHWLGRLVAEQQKPDHNPLFDLFTFTGTSKTAKHWRDVSPSTT